MQKIVREIRELVSSRWELGPLHGVTHWDRVYENGRKLLTPKVDPLVVGLFAYLHDSCRKNDYEDIYHGQRAAQWIETLRDTYLKELTDEQFELLHKACKYHTILYKMDNPTIDACFDADRLDLWRVGVVPNPQKMATKKGKLIAQTTDYSKLIEIEE